MVSHIYTPECPLSKADRGEKAQRHLQRHRL